MPNHQEIKTRWLELKSNCDYYFSRIINYPLAPPEHLYFTITERCNLKCKMCNVPLLLKYKEDELTFAECKDLINQVFYLKINHLIFSGGEPLLREDIFDLIKYARSKPIKMVDVITNGLLINDKKAKALINSGVTHVTVSMDGIGEVSDFIRGKGTFQKAVYAIDLINKYKNNGMPTIGINFTIMDCNIDQILPMIDLAREKRCNIIVFQPLLPDNTVMQERKKNELWVSDYNIPKLNEVVKKVIELKQSLRDISIHVNDKILTMIPTYFAGAPLDKSLKCYEGFVRIVITSNGEVWSCQGAYGNLRERSLKDIWFSREANDIRNKVYNCQSHCLQSCIHLAELTDIYSEIRKFKILVDKDKAGREYINRLLMSLINYRFRLGREKIKQYLQKIVRQSKKDNLRELNLEIAEISKITKDLSLNASK